MSLEVEYKGTQIAQLTQDGSLTLETAGKFCEADIELAYSGGGSGSTANAGKPVRLIDYDGTVLYGYTAADFAELETMPANPSHTGLVAQGWNWTLANAKAYVAKYGHLTIGQMYTTESGATEIDIEVPSNCQIKSGLMYEGTLTYDWGDGSAPEPFTIVSMDNPPQEFPTHTYEEAGFYTITITPDDGTEYVIDGGGTDPSGNYHAGASWLVFSEGASGVSHDYGCFYYVVAVRIGDNCTIGNGALAGYYRLKTLTIPSTVTSIGVNALAFDYHPTTSVYPGMCDAIVIPSSVTSIDSTPKSASTISLPYGVTAINEIDCPILMSMDIPDSVTNIGKFAFKSLGAFAITFPESVTEIDFEAFNGMKNVREMHVLPTTPPTTSGHGAYDADPSLGSLPSDCVIYVPAGSVDAYKAATGWSTHASKIQAEPA